MGRILGTALKWGFFIAVIVFLLLIMGVIQTANGQGLEITPEGFQSLDPRLIDGNTPAIPGDNPVDIVTGGETTITVENRTETLELLLGMAAAVAFFMEMLKAGVLKRFHPDGGANPNGLSPDVYSFVVMLLAFIVAFVVVSLSPPDVNIFTAAGITRPIPLLLAQLVTALTVAFGNTVMHAVYDLLRSSHEYTYLDPTARG